MRQVQNFKALRPVPRSKRLRLAREEAALERDIQIAWAAMLTRVTTHNMTRAVFAPPRASPAIH